MTTQSGVDVVERARDFAKAQRKMAADAKEDMTHWHHIAVADVIDQQSAEIIALRSQLADMTRNRDYHRDRAEHNLTQQRAAECALATERSRVAEAERAGIERAAKWHDGAAAILRSDANAASRAGVDCSDSGGA